MTPILYGPDLTHGTITRCLAEEESIGNSAPHCSASLDGDGREGERRREEDASHACCIAAGTATSAAWPPSLQQRSCDLPTTGPESFWYE